MMANLLFAQGLFGDFGDWRNTGAMVVVQCLQAIAFFALALTSVAIFGATINKIASLVIFACDKVKKITYLGAPVCFRDWRKTGARLARFWAGFLRQSAPVLGNPFRGSRLAQLAQPAIGAKNDDQDWRNETSATSNPMAAMFAATLATETDQREGFDHGRAGKRFERGRSDTYTDAWLRGAEARRVAERGV